ncbi:hypothetical protein VNO77_07518 [Canavalia gladiata]|uniref:Uncharacterized protein n=1 Tax=Canavalia gladiata TaxID=3824 RepID=A0AAN9M7P3_CANGL
MPFKDSKLFSYLQRLRHHHELHAIFKNTRSSLTLLSSLQSSLTLVFTSLQRQLHHSPTPQSPPPPFGAILPSSLPPTMPLSAIAVLLRHEDPFHPELTEELVIQAKILL